MCGYGWISWRHSPLDSFKNDEVTFAPYCGGTYATTTK